MIIQEFAEIIKRFEKDNKETIDKLVEGFIGREDLRNRVTHDFFQMCQNYPDSSEAKRQTRYLLMSEGYIPKQNNHPHK